MILIFKNKKLIIGKMFFFVLMFVATKGITAQTSESIEIKNIKVLTADTYFKEVYERICKAKHSVYINMYYIKNFKNKTTRAGRLIDQLIKKQKQGVNIYLMVEGDRSLKKKKKLNSKHPITDYNKKIFRYLRKNGVYIIFDDPKKITHAKTVVVDEKYLFCGSANWTEPGLSMNTEANVFVESKKLAGEVIKYFEKLEKVGFRD